MKYTVCLIISILLSFCISSAQAQSLTDSLTQRQVKQALDKIYNYEFAAAEPMIASIQKRYPKHPVSSLLMALSTSWKNFPMDAKQQAYQTYQNYLKEVLTRTANLFGENTNNPEGIFFALSAHSYLSLVASEEKDYMKALGEAKKAYNFMKKGFDLLNKYPEFYFSTGLYNYYVEQYPENHPVVKPFMFFFADGDKELGLKQMDLGVNTGIFTRTEAAYWLAYIYIKHESKPLKALQYTQKLIAKYPENIHYIMRHVEVLIASAKYEQVQPFVNQLLAEKHKIFQSTAYVFLGLIQEKQYKNYTLARTHYYHAFKITSPDKRYTQDYYALAYAGLARIAAKEGNKQAAKNFYKKTLELAEYASTIKEAKFYLKND